MLCTWAWLDSFGNYCGDYQSDTDDLKAFLRRVSRSSLVKLLYCKLQDRKEYLWRNPLWFKKGGWVSF